MRSFDPRLFTLRGISGQQSFAARPKDVDRDVGRISINDAGLSYGYQPFHRYIGADEGDSLLAEFDLAQSQVVLSINDDRMLEDS